MTEHLSPLALFRKGYDTLAIAKKLRKTEDYVWRAIHQERCIETGDTSHEDSERRRRERESEERQRRAGQYRKRKGLIPYVGYSRA